MKTTKLLLAVLAFAICQPAALAQATNPDFMRSMGKMYVVVAVIVTIFLGLILFLVFLDRRLTNIENQIKDNG